MAIIPLRAYNHEIEGLIDNKQLDEAVAHCRHILTTFPKYIATYRLLGKAHLEQQRISDATDIFQRVLSAIPDDFTANVGMSIIREDENNLDASIWHMELAYEAQPSNVAIQDELRRLYGRRDGAQPPKVRLTRGALARMYAKGGLFDQAIAELRAAISEDPNRPDLQLLLAQMLFQISQRVDAVEMCVNILKKLPFCLSANQILAVCLPEVEGSNTRKNYRQAAISMDPYFAFADLESINSDQVPDNAVNNERLDSKPGIQMDETTEQPTWATSLGISMEKPAEEQMPDWLQGADAPPPVESDEPVENAVSPFFWDTQEVKNIINDDQKPEEEIPGWMKDAGWKSSTGEAGSDQSDSPAGESSPGSPEAEELAKADIPDWLRGIAPEGVLDEASAATQPEEKDESLPWLEKQQPGPTDSIIQWLEEKQPETPAPKTGSIEASGEPQEDIPDWLKDLDTPLASPEPEKPEGTAATSAETPAFIEEPIEEDSVLPEIPETPEMEQSQEPGQPLEQAAETGETLGEEAIQAEEPQGSATEELPDWIKELAGILPATTPEQVVEEIEAQPTAVEDVPVVKSDAFLDEPPAAELPTEEQVQAEPVVEPVTSASDAEILSWMEDQPAAVTGKEEEPVSPLVEQPISTTDWLNLEATNEEVPSQEEPETGQPPAIPVEEVPDWIKGLGETPTEEISAEPVSETPADEEALEAAELPTWLLEFEQPAEEPDTSQPVPEALEWKEEQLPDWIRDITGETPAEEALKAAETEETPTTPLEAETEWAPEEENLVAQEQAAPVERHPDEQGWVAEPEVTEPEVGIPAIEVEAAQESVTREITPQDVEIPSTPLPEEPVLTVPEAQPTDLPTLEGARDAITRGVPSEAAELYASLVHRALHLDEVLKDLQDAVYRFPVDVNLWVTLGDTYFQKNELQEALDTYSKAEELVR